MTITRRTFLQAATTATSAAALALPTQADDGKQASATGAVWKPRSLAQKPNIVMVVLDDVGFADLGCYGAEHRTPCIDGIAASGTRFNNFHVTALCAPTRACLLTGRNAHAVGVGNIAEWGRPLPGYRGWIRQDAMTLAEMLRPAGYSTLAVGKWHLSSLEDQNASGPFDHWPVGRGFDRWYGFHGNAMDHWHPEMFENTVAAYPDKSDEYHLSDDLARRSREYIADHVSATPDKPFFLYLAFGAMHFPLHAPSSDIERYRGQYDVGWDAIRRSRFQQQQSTGVVPEAARLAPRNPNVPEWNELSEDQRRAAARGQEVYAAFLEHTDRQLEQLVNFLRAEGQYDNTILMVLSDNGAAPGGPIEGRLDVRRDAYFGAAPLDELISDLDLMGTDASYASYSRGWAQASNTPLKWYKADTFEGGIRSPLIVSWPQGRLPQGRINAQYHHAIDVAPTLLEMIGTPAPKTFRGHSALPLQGVSFAYSFDHPEAPTPKTVQYFETLGDRAVWANGWKAVSRHTPGTPFEEDVWELYHAAEDFSETENLSEQLPEKLQELIALWQSEAEKYDVLPMDDDTLGLYQRAVPAPRATYVFYPGMTRLDRLSAPDIYQFSSRFLATVNLPRRANGVIVAAGDSSCGYEWYIKDGRVKFVYVLTRNEIFRTASRSRVSAGEHTLALEIRRTGESSAMIKLLIDDTVDGELALEKMWPIYAPNSGVRCGENRHAPISRDYPPPFALGDALARVQVDVDI